MRRVLPSPGALIFVAALFFAHSAGAQEARPFEDVKPDSWAYQSVSDLQNKGIVTGYPDGHFNGQRTLTRYEFAVALKRALDRVPGLRSRAESAAPASAGRMDLTRSEVEAFQRLTTMFKDELESLSVDVKEIRTSLDKLAKSATSGSGRIDRPAAAGSDFAIGAGAGRAEFALPDYTVDLRRPGEGLFSSARGSYSQDAFAIRARVGSGTATLFGGSLNGSPATLAAPSGRGAFASSAGGVLQSASQPSPFSYLASSGAFSGPGYGLRSRGGYSEFGGVPGRISGLQGDVPLTKNAEFGLTFLDFSPTDSLAGPGSAAAGSPSGGVSLYGANIRVNPAGRLALSGEASKSFMQRSPLDSDGRGTDDNNAFLLNLNYNGGPITGSAGYQYYDPRFIAPGSANRIGSWYNPSNVQGPFARVGGRFDNLQADLGVDFLSGARNRPGFGGFTQGSSVIHGQAGLGYHFSKQFELTAQYEGVLYDMSGAISASGMRAKPVEQYITLGAGLNLTGNTVLRLAYQIINVQDAGNGFGLAPALGGTAASTSVFTTQFAVHF